ncbi:hypothetical protein SERLA73DRAFT_153242 [Serpula lacrymans var. lacrymans S7.3]|uniref:Uncharacterized protein n=1 Tax=Serpula lacrymans var. lacrymans (strain S7.3) TaxID=936435 RepID=F8Q167_SERL3|nr:hypothetical protein SERLA73DRAFT_153242 [Serpula lacrymans var. lacrymans S7.3]
MAALPSQNSPWPAQTPSPPTSPSRSKRKRQHDLRSPRQSTVAARQISEDPQYVAAQTQCETYSGNNIVSCFPSNGTVVLQHQYAGFVWNSRRPQITQTNQVNLYLYDADSLSQLFAWYNKSNPLNGTPGTFTTLVNDTWFGEKGASWAPGQNMSYQYFWILTSAEEGLDGSQTTQPTFTALHSVASSISSASVASASSASLSSVPTSVTTSGSAETSISSPGSVQSQGDKTAIPHWAIAVIVVLGFLAIVAGGVMTWLIMRRLRRRSASSNRGSMGSSSPMMANVQNSNSPQLPLLGGMGAVGAGDHATSDQHHAPSVVSPDGASTISRANSAGDSGPFSGADAAIMADAFRKALRKPDFAGAPVDEGDGSDPQDGRKDNELLSRELAEEGRDIRSVSSSRGVRVETLSDAGDTVQDH